MKTKLNVYVETLAYHSGKVDHGEAEYLGELGGWEERLETFVEMRNQIFTECSAHPAEPLRLLLIERSFLRSV